VHASKKTSHGARRFSTFLGRWFSKLFFRLLNKEYVCYAERARCLLAAAMFWKDIEARLRNTWIRQSLGNVAFKLAKRKKF
jgi:hypothetical protein